ncbi:MAG: branched-chain amino acid ABC transporter permease [Candidatus Dormibacteria bacterium]
MPEAPVAPVNPGGAPEAQLNPEPLVDSTATPDTGIAETITESRRTEASTVVWLLAASGVLLLIAGWLLPWQVSRAAGGIGFSAQDALFGFTGPGSLAIFIVGIAMLGLLVGLVYDAVCTVSGRGRPFRNPRERGVLAVVGALATVAAVVVAATQEEPLFGKLEPRYSFIDNAPWMVITGFILCAVAYGLRPLVLRNGGRAFALVAFALGGAFPLIFNHSGDFISWGARFAAVYVLLALGLNVVVGFAGLLDLGYAAFFAIGAYTTASFASSKYGIHLPFWVLVFLGAAVAAVFGALLGAPTLRLRGDYLAIVTLGFGEIVPDLATNNFGNLTGGPNGLSADAASLFGHNFGQLGAFPENTKYYFWTILVLIAGVVLALRNLERSRLGRAWVAIREDEVAAAATGINTTTTKLLAFAIGASVSGFAGAFFGAMLGTVTPENFEFAVSVTALTTVVLGGLGNIVGVSVGAVLLAFVINWVLPHIQEWSGTVGTTTGVNVVSGIDFSRYTYIVYGVILVGIMLLRPSGLIPSQARKVELDKGGDSESLAAVTGSA